MDYYDAYNRVFMENERFGRVKKYATTFMILSILAPIIGFTIVSELGEINIFNGLGSIRYSWIIYFFAVFPITCLIFGIYFARKRRACVRFFIIPIISLVFITAFGSMRFMRQINTGTDGIVKIEEKFSIDLPDDLDALTDIGFDGETIIYAKVLNSSQKEQFESTLAEHPLWKDSLNNAMKLTFPFSVDHLLESSDYFIYYNETSGLYNTFQEEGTYTLTIIGYNVSLGRIIIVTDYEIKDE